MHLQAAHRRPSDCGTPSRFSPRAFPPGMTGDDLPRKCERVHKNFRGGAGRGYWAASDLRASATPCNWCRKGLTRPRKGTDALAKSLRAKIPRGQEGYVRLSARGWPKTMNHLDAQFCPRRPRGRHSKASRLKARGRRNGIGALARVPASRRSGRIADRVGNHVNGRPRLRRFGIPVLHSTRAVVEKLRDRGVAAPGKWEEQ